MDEHCGRAEAAMVTWNWREDEFSPPAPSSAGAARLRGTIQGAVGISIAALVYVFLSHTAAMVIFGIASTIALAAVISPEGLFAGIESVFRATGRVFGRLMTWLLLSLIFYSFFVPFGALFRRGHRDSMKRLYEPDAPTYWTSREPREAGLAFYERQF